MPSIEIGPLTILMSDDGPYPDIADVPGRGKVDVQVHPATVMADGGVSLDVRFCVADDGEGVVDCVSIEQSSGHFERLTHGARIGVYPCGDGLCIMRLRVIRYDIHEGWGNPKLTSMEELDNLAGGDVTALLTTYGAQAVGKKSQVLGAKGNDIGVVWPDDAGPQLPIVAYALTRILPILRVVQGV